MPEIRWRIPLLPPRSRRNPGLPVVQGVPDKRDPTNGVVMLSGTNREFPAKPAKHRQGNIGFFEMRRDASAADIDPENIMQTAGPAVTDREGALCHKYRRNHPCHHRDRQGKFTALALNEFGTIVTRASQISPVWGAYDCEK